jgi:SAM-dependent methyltransferase
LLRRNRAIERDPVPVPATEDREGYFGDRHLSYWLSGLADVRAVRADPIPAAAFADVLELGGASGRVARHLALGGQPTTVTVAELNVNHVEWVEANFPVPVRAVKLGPFPHLPLPDGSVTLCTAFSVFTHIDSYESGWLAEVHRVLAAGGYAYLTVHSEDTWNLLPGAYVYQALESHPDFARAFRPGEPMPGERLVFDYNPESNEYHCNVFHHSDYVRRRWGKWFEVVAIRPRAHTYQTAVVLRKRIGSPPG